MKNGKKEFKDGVEVEFWILRKADFGVVVEFFQIGNVKLHKSRYLLTTRRIPYLGSGSSSSRSARRLSMRFVGDSL